MKILLSIIGIVLLLPIAVILVGIIATTLLGGYLALVVQLFWEIFVIVAAIIIVVKLIRWLMDKK